MEDIQMSSPKPSDLAIASPPTKRRRSSAFKDADSLPLLEMVVEFKSRNGGANPTPTNIKPLYDSAKATLLSAVNDFTPEQLYNRIRHLRFRYNQLLQSGSTDRRHRSFLELSARAWGDSQKTSTVGAALVVPEKKMAAEEEEEMDHDDAEEEAGNINGDSFECLNRHAKEYWGAMQLNADDLKMGLKKMDRERAKAVEVKWIQHSEVGMKIQAKQCKLERELFAALLSAQKGTKRNP